MDGPLALWEAINNFHLSLSAIKETNQSHRGMQLICCASRSNGLSVWFLFLTFPMIPSPNSSKWKKAGHSSNRSCALGVVAVCARGIVYLNCGHKLYYYVPWTSTRGSVSCG